MKKCVTEIILPFIDLLYAINKIYFNSSLIITRRIDAIVAIEFSHNTHKLTTLPFLYNF